MTKILVELTEDQVRTVLLMIEERFDLLNSFPKDNEAANKESAFLRRLRYRLTNFQDFGED